MAGEKRPSAAEPRPHRRSSSRDQETRSRVMKRKGTKPPPKANAAAEAPTSQLPDAGAGLAPEDAASATLRKVALYREIVELDCSHLLYTETMVQCFPAGPAAARAINDAMTKIVKNFKEHAARQLAAYEALGYIPGYTPPADLVSSSTTTTNAGNVVPSRL